VEQSRRFVTAKPCRHRRSPTLPTGQWKKWLVSDRIVSLRHDRILTIMSVVKIRSAAGEIGGF